MIIVLALLFFCVGVALILNAFIISTSPRDAYPRFEAKTSRGRRFWPVATGLVVALGGVALVLLS